MMKSGVLAALSALLFLSCVGPLEASRALATERACIGEKAWIASVRQRSKGFRIQVLSDVRGIPAEALVSRLNADPPETNFTADHVMIVGAHMSASGQQVPYVLIALFEHGCLVQWSRADPRLIASLLGGEPT